MTPAPTQAVHQPVLLAEVLSAVQAGSANVVVDGTVGAGGHSSQILKQLKAGSRLIGLDRDLMMLDFARQKLTFPNAPQFDLVHSSYRDMRKVLDDLEIEFADRVLLDLGLSSDQLAHQERGFGFQTSGDLDLRFDNTSGQPAWEWLQNESEADIIEGLVQYGEEPHAECIARQIVKQRKQNSPIRTVPELVSVIEECSRSRGGTGKSHPATRTFQALRILVNQELQHLQTFLETGLPQSLHPNGIVAIITFHSIEDRMVKQAFQTQNGWKELHKKPVAPRALEVKMNPRSRSAKLRVAQRISPA